MAGSTYRNDKAGIGKVLKSMAPVITGKAQEVADAIRTTHPDLTVTVQPYTTDRSAAVVLVEDIHARELQVREGLITKAAGIVGLEVKAK